MKKIYILLVRIIVSITIATIISMFFFNGIHAVKTPSLAAALLILAYLFENTRKKE